MMDQEGMVRLHYRLQLHNDQNDSERVTTQKQAQTDTSETDSVPGTPLRRKQSYTSTPESNTKNRQSIDALVSQNQIGPFRSKILLDTTPDKWMPHNALGYSILKGVPDVTTVLSITFIM